MQVRIGHAQLPFLIQPRMKHEPGPSPSSSVYCGYSLIVDPSPRGPLQLQVVFLLRVLVRVLLNFTLHRQLMQLEVTGVVQ